LYGERDLWGYRENEKPKRENKYRKSKNKYKYQQTENISLLQYRVIVREELK